MILSDRSLLKREIETVSRSFIDHWGAKMVAVHFCLSSFLPTINLFQSLIDRHLLLDKSDRKLQHSMLAKAIRGQPAITLHRKEINSHGIPVPLEDFYSTQNQICPKFKIQRSYSFAQYATSWRQL